MKTLRLDAERWRFDWPEPGSWGRSLGTACLGAGQESALELVRGDAEGDFRSVDVVDGTGRMRRLLKLLRLLGVLAVSGAFGLAGATLAADQQGLRPSLPILVATILAAPETFEGKQVVVQGTVVEAARKVFPNGRPYHTVSVGNGEAVLTVFSWSRLPVRAGERIEAIGVFHVWRYNLRHMIEAGQVNRLERAR